MAGKTYLFRGKEVLVEGVSATGSGRYTVRTEKRMIPVTEAQLREEFLPVANEPVVANLAIYRALEQHNIPVKEIGDTLMEMIRLVKQDPKHIDQAKAISELAKTQIDLRRLQLEAVKVARGLG